MKTIVEKNAAVINGYIALILFFALVLFNGYWLVSMIRAEEPRMLLVFIPSIIINFIALGGFLLCSRMNRVC